MVSHPKLGSDPPIGSDRESGCDNQCYQLSVHGREKDKEPDGSFAESHPSS